MQTANLSRLALALSFYPMRGAGRKAVGLDPHCQARAAAAEQTKSSTKKPLKKDPKASERELDTKQVLLCSWDILYNFMGSRHPAEHPDKKWG